MVPGEGVSTVVEELAERRGAACSPGLLAIYAVQMHVREDCCCVHQVDPYWRLSCAAVAIVIAAHEAGRGISSLREACVNKERLSPWVLANGLGVQYFIKCSKV